MKKGSHHHLSLISGAQLLGLIPKPSSWALGNATRDKSLLNLSVGDTRGMLRGFLVGPPKLLF